MRTRDEAEAEARAEREGAVDRLAEELGTLESGSYLASWIVHEVATFKLLSGTADERKKRRYEKNLSSNLFGAISFCSLEEMKGHRRQGKAEPHEIIPELKDLGDFGERIAANLIRDIHYAKLAIRSDSSEPSFAENVRFLNDVFSHCDGVVDLVNRLAKKLREDASITWQLKVAGCNKKTAFEGPFRLKLAGVSETVPTNAA